MSSGANYHWERTGNGTPIRGEYQGHDLSCFFAAMATAFNYLLGAHEMSDADLRGDHPSTDYGNVGFDTFAYASKRSSVPIERLPEFELSRHRVDEFLLDCGIVIASLAVVDENQVEKGYHALLVLPHEPGTDRYQVWDPARGRGFGYIDWHELESEIQVEHGWVLRPHPGKDCCALRRR